MSTEREIEIHPALEADLPQGAELPSGADLPQGADLPVNGVCAQAEQLLAEIYDFGSEGAREPLHELLARFAAQAEQSGSADDYHNLAVTLARRDEYALACQALDCGLARFPKNVDLLADALEYGTRCGRLEACRRHCRTLCRIPRRRWTWRGFSFYIDYQLFLLDRTDTDAAIDALAADMLAVAADFARFFPYSEEPFRNEALVYAALNEAQKEEETLRRALASVRVAPKCALRYADLLYDRGLYSQAAEAIARALRDANRTQSSIREGYLYYLSGLCRFSAAQEAGSLQDLDESAAREIYSDFELALESFQDRQASYAQVIREKTIALVRKSRIEVDPALERLCDCIAD